MIHGWTNCRPICASVRWPVSSSGANPLFTRVTTGRELVDELATDRAGLSFTEAVSRLQGTLIGPDGSHTCAVVTLSDDARRNLRAALGEIRAAAAEIGLPADAVHLGGPAVVNDAIDQSSTESLVRLAGLAAVVGLAITWLCFRTVRLTIIVVVIASYSAALSLAVVPLCGVALNAILITMVPLVYVAAMSGAIHLSNYYLESLQRVGASAAIGDAVRHAALPLGLATATTAIGLLSLWYSDLEPIRMFGLFSAVGVLIGLAMQLVALPALLCVWPQSSGRSSAWRTVDRRSRAGGRALDARLATSGFLRVGTPWTVFSAVSGLLGGGRRRSRSH